ncbi:hypothetical protein [Actinokineospora fastidiosa]|uniref:PH domain-containing protein n=1 Tax=Actinokineospora fastidiosa TaxID=1816 RepID=A0A918G284_9PSEU|nr:hypothetical protein [Actinokineospora fastidiosa]GGS14718.1 hypothetical protein GCM10010171_03290 [Actinokineospora fastidiosa]
MATTYRPTPAYTAVYAVTTGIAAGAGVLAIHLTIDAITGRWQVAGALIAAGGIGLVIGALTAGAVRRRSLTLVHDGLVVVRDHVRTVLRWRDFEQVRTIGLFKRDELVFRAAETTAVDPDKPAPRKAVERMRRNGSDRTVIVSDFVPDWKSTDLHTAVRRHSRG